MRIGLIGCGKMGSALLRGILSNQCDSEHVITLYDIHESHALELKSKLPLSSTTVVSSSTPELITNAEIVLLCVKPDNVEEALSSTSEWNNRLLISIVAGVKASTLATLTSQKARIIRVMPNTPALINEGASAFCRGHQATDADAELTITLFSGVGSCCEVQESLLNAVTGLSGSGPAYAFTIIEALTDAGVKQGLPRHIALELSCQTLKGASMMVQNTGLHPAQLRDQVTSPGGTTIAGVAALEANGLRNALFSAVEAATQRSSDLGKAL